MTVKAKNLVVYNYNASTWEIEARGTGIQSCLQLNSKLEASLGYMPPSKTNNKKQTEVEDLWFKSMPVKYEAYLDQSTDSQKPMEISGEHYELPVIPALIDRDCISPE